MHVPFNALGRQTDFLRPQIDAAINRVLDSGWFIQGPEHDAFEREFAAYCGVAHCLGVGNGTDALELCLRAVGCGPGDEVITVANAGMYATSACVSMGATPVFADIDESSHLVDTTSLEDAISPATRAIVVTHLYGQLADVESIVRTVAPLGISVIEDCAQAHGARRDGKRAGSFADVAAFSFYPTKNLGAVGDAGAIVTDNDSIASRVRSLRQYGWDRKYNAAVPGGRNSRLDEMQAAVLRAKLQLLDEWNQRRRDIAEQYRSVANGTDLRLLGTAGDEYVGHLCVGVHPDRDGLRAALASLGIDTAIHFPTPDHRQPALSSVVWRSPGLSVTDQAAREVLSLPCFPELTFQEIEHVCQSLDRAL